MVVCMQASRRMKTEFLVQLDGAGTDQVPILPYTTLSTYILFTHTVHNLCYIQAARVVIVGATNRPDELDEAARRRFVKRIYIPLPDVDGRRQLLYRLLKDCVHNLTEEEVEELAVKTAGYSGADIKSLCTESAMGPMREIATQCGDLNQIRIQDVPHVTSAHFTEAYETMAPSVSPGDLQRYVDWNTAFGSFRRME